MIKVLQGYVIVEGADEIGVYEFFLVPIYPNGTNLDNILKSRDITLLTKVHTAKAMAFPVDMYGCESWIIKNVEC